VLLILQHSLLVVRLLVVAVVVVDLRVLVGVQGEVLARALV
jgi:hypothetical protein